LYLPAFAGATTSAAISRVGQALGAVLGWWLGAVRLELAGAQH